jgi:hypothetical protein
VVARVAWLAWEAVVPHGDPITVNIVSSEAPSSPEKVSNEPKLSANQLIFFRLLYDAGSDGLTLEEWNGRAKEVAIGTAGWLLMQPTERIPLVSR